MAVVVLPKAQVDANWPDTAACWAVVVTELVVVWEICRAKPSAEACCARPALICNVKCSVQAGPVLAEREGATCLGIHNHGRSAAISTAQLCLGQGTTALGTQPAAQHKGAQQGGQQ